MEGQKGKKITNWNTFCLQKVMLTLKNIYIERDVFIYSGHQGHQSFHFTDRQNCAGILTNVRITFCILENGTATSLGCLLTGTKK